MPVPPDPSAPPTGAALRTLQLIWLSFVGVLVVVGVLIPVVATPADPELPVWLPAVLAAAVGAAAIVGVVAVDRSFGATPPATDDDAVMQYRTRLFMQAAMTEFPALLAAAMAFVLGPPWVASVGAGAGVVALLLVRPSEAKLATFDRSWRAVGADVSLQRALLGHAGTP